MPLYFPPDQNFLQKSLGAQLGVGITASATFNNTTNIQNRAGVFIVDRIDTNGNVISPATKREVIAYTATSGSTVTTLSRGLAGTTDQVHAVGAVVEFVPDVIQQQGILDALLSIVTEAGIADTTKVVTPTGSQTLTNKTLTSPILTAPVLNTSLSGTAFLDEDDMISNSATRVASQQSIKAYVDALNNGWIDSIHTFVFASASTFTIASIDATTTYPKGTKLRLKQGAGFKYFYVTNVSFSTNTTVTVSAGTAFTIANAAITDNDYSYSSMAEGFPTSFVYDCAPFGATGSAGAFAQTSNTAYFSVSGGRCFVNAVGKITNVGSWTGSLYHNLPISPSATIAVSNGKFLIESQLNTMKAMAANVNTSPSAILQWNTGFLTAELAWTGVVANDCYLIEISYPI